jgi:hypothetical protein
MPPALTDALRTAARSPLCLAVVLTFFATRLAAAEQTEAEVRKTIQAFYNAFDQGFTESTASVVCREGAVAYSPSPNT